MIRYKCLRISVTDRCDLACAYCRSECGREREDLLSFEDISCAVNLLTDFGISHVRLTGGEPLLRRGISSLVERLIQNPDIETVAITTNGTRLASEARGLKLAGLSRINVHLDTLNGKKYRRLTATGDLSSVLKGIEAAVKLDMNLKLNTVLLRGINDDVRPLINFAADLGVPIRFIELMPFCSGEFFKGHFVSADGLIRELRKKTELLSICGEFGNGPASYYKEESSGAVVGFVTPMSNRFCLSCDRLRLTSDGRLRRCLAKDEDLDLKRRGFDMSVVENYLLGKELSNGAFTEIRGFSMQAIGG